MKNTILIVVLCLAISFFYCEKASSTDASICDGVDTLEQWIAASLEWKSINPNCKPTDDIKKMKIYQAKELYDMVSYNEVFLRMEFRDKRIALSGAMTRISFAQDRASLYIFASKYGDIVECIFLEDESKNLAKIKVNEKVTLICSGVGKTEYSSIQLNKCLLVKNGK